MYIIGALRLLSLLQAGASPTVVPMQIYVHRNNQQLGPFSEAELQVLINTGAVSLQDPVWWQGQATWLPLSQTSLASKLIPAAPGVGVPSPGFPVGTEKTSSLAIWSLVCGIFAFFCGITSIPAIILGHMGLSETKRNPALQGRGMALAGTILGYMILALNLILIVFFVLVALGDQVKSTFSTIQTQEKAAQTQSSHDNDSDVSTNSAPATDGSTNTPPAITP